MLRLSLRPSVLSSIYSTLFATLLAAPFLLFATSGLAQTDQGAITGTVRTARGQ